MSDRAAEGGWTESFLFLYEEALSATAETYVRDKFAAGYPIFVATMPGFVALREEVRSVGLLMRRREGQLATIVWSFD